MFSEAFISVLIVASLVLIAAASITLLVMVVKDIKNKKVW